MDKNIFERTRGEFPKTLEDVREKFPDKIFDKPGDQKYLRLLVNLARQERKKIVTTNGTFDVFHEGHAAGLTGAKNCPPKEDGVFPEDTILIVFVNTDASVREYKKLSPHHSERERMEAVAALPEVDFVFPLSDTTPNNLLEITRSDYHVKGSEYDTKNEDWKIPGPTEQEVVEKYGGKMIFIHRPEDSITSGRIRQNAKKN